MEDKDYVPNLIEAIPAGRFATYRQLVATDEAAWELYSANVAYSAAFYAPLQALEVALRNAIDRELSRRHPGWLTGTTVLHGLELPQVADAQDRLARQSKAVDHGRLIAELSFGFWSGLFADAYDRRITANPAQYVRRP